MKYHVVVLRCAEADVRQIVNWIALRSIQGANSWLDAYEDLIERLGTDAETFPAAVENSDCQIALKQALFSTRHGHIYRAVFTIVGRQVRILRVRGSGQPPLLEDELL